MVRSKLWTLGLSGIFNNYSNFIFGIGDFGKINILQWVTKENFNVDTIGFVFDSGFFQTHLHNDYVALVYGSGIFFLFLYLSFIFNVIIKLIRSHSLNNNFIFALVILTFSIHGLTEPILTSPYSSFIIWMSFFFIFPAKRNFKFDNASKKSRLLDAIPYAFVFILTLSMLYDIRERKIFQFIASNPYLKQEIRGFIDNRQNKPIKMQEELKQVKDNLDSRIYFIPFPIGNLENRADIFMYHALVFQDAKSFDQATNIYCSLFQMQPIPRHYNNLRNLTRYKPANVQGVCSSEINMMIHDYDKFELIYPDFY